MQMKIKADSIVQFLHYLFDQDHVFSERLSASTSIVDLRPESDARNYERLPLDF